MSYALPPSGDEDPRPEPTPQQKLQVLTDARVLLSEHGWMQGRYYDPSTDCFCAVGAVEEAAVPGLYTDERGSSLDLIDHLWTEKGRIADEAVHELTETLAQDWGFRPSIITWNDKHTEAEVLDLFDRTIARLTEAVAA